MKGKRLMNLGGSSDSDKGGDESRRGWLTNFSTMKDGGTEKYQTHGWLN